MKNDIYDFMVLLLLGLTWVWIMIVERKVERERRGGGK